MLAPEPQVTSNSSGPDTLGNRTNTLGNRTNAPSPMSPAVRRAAIPWSVVGAVVLELRTRRAPDYLAPLDTLLDTLLDRVMTSRSARVGILLFWWWAGWHFLVGQAV